MSEENITFNREDLYAQAWEIPMTKLASQYGLSDNGLRKICRKLSIPTPPAGFWARLQHGKKVFKKPLPKLKSGEPEKYTLDIKPHLKRYSEKDLKIEETTALEENTKKIIVYDRLSSAHPLVVLTRDVLSEAKPDKYGVLRPWGKKYLDMRVSPASLSRALRIMDAVVKAFEERNYKVEIREDRAPESYALIQEEKLRFSINEKINQTDHVPTEKEMLRKQKYSWETPPRWDYTPSGLLILQIKEHGADGLRKLWSDGKSKKLEDILNDFIAGSIKVAVVSREVRLRREKEWEEARKREEEERQKRFTMESFIRNLERDADLWARSKMVRSYISEIEKVMALRSDKHIHEENFQKWLTMAKQYADQIDPLKRELSFEDTFLKLDD